MRKPVMPDMGSNFFLKTLPFKADQLGSDQNQAGNIPKQPEESVSASVGQPPLFVPPASLNFLSLAASAPASLDENRGASLADSRFFKSFRYKLQETVRPVNNSTLFYLYLERLKNRKSPEEIAKISLPGKSMILRHVSEDRFDPPALTVACPGAQARKWWRKMAQKGSFPVAESFAIASPGNQKSLTTQSDRPGY